VRAVVQRVLRGEVRVGEAGDSAGAIGPGAVVLLGVAAGDTEATAEKLARKTAKLRIFPDGDKEMDRAADPSRGEDFLVVSQFTLCADTRKGNRPSFISAAPPERAEALYEHFVRTLRAEGFGVETGRFRTHMVVSLANDGPVTILLEAD